MERILEILENDCNTSPAQIALMLDMKEADVVAAIEDFKKRGIINHEDPSVERYAGPAAR